MEIEFYFDLHFIVALFMQGNRFNALEILPYNRDGSEYLFHDTLLIQSHLHDTFLSVIFE